jgi:hypothetical protein
VKRRKESEGLEKEKKRSTKKTIFRKKTFGRRHRRAPSLAAHLSPLPPVAMARGRAFFSLATALLALCVAVTAVAGAEVTPKVPAEAASSVSVALSNAAAGETKKAAAANAPISPPSGVQVTVFRASGWPTGTLAIPATVVNDVSDRLSLYD